MNISDKQIHNLLRNYTRYIEKTVPKENAEKTSRGEKSHSDEVVLSDRAHEARLIREILRNTSLVREKKVQRLSELIEKGQYSVSASEVAEKMISDLFTDKLQD